MTHLACLVRDQRGAAAVEMALVLPMVMALMFGSLEVGNYMLTEHKVIKGVRNGARYAARLPFSKFDCAAGTVNDTTAVDDIKAVTRTGQANGTGTNRVRGWTDAEVAVSVSCDTTTNAGIYKGVGAAPRVMVSTTVRYPSVLGMLGFDTSGAVVRAQAQAAVMGT